MTNQFLEGSKIDDWRRDVAEETGVELTREQATKLWVEFLFIQDGGHPRRICPNCEADIIDDGGTCFFCEEGNEPEVSR